jgi:hypothetical protein
MEQALGKTDQKPRFFFKSREAVPKTEIFEQPLSTCMFFKSLGRVIHAENKGFS